MNLLIKVRVLDPQPMENNDFWWGWGSVSVSVILSVIALIYILTVGY